MLLFFFNSAQCSSTCVNTHAYMYVYAHAHVHAHVCARARAHTHVPAHICPHICPHISTCALVHAHTHIRVCVCVWSQLEVAAGVLHTPGAIATGVEDSNVYVADGKRVVVLNREGQYGILKILFWKVLVFELEVLEDVPDTNNDPSAVMAVG